MIHVLGSILFFGPYLSCMFFGLGYLLYLLYMTWVDLQGKRKTNRIFLQAGLFITLFVGSMVIGAILLD